MASSESSPEETEEPKNTKEDNSLEPREIRLAKVSVTRTGHGVAMDVIAGKLRVRLYIDAQWTELLQNIAAGKGELDHLVPFRMVPLEIKEEEATQITPESEATQITPESLEARRIPELSREHPLFGTPLWDAIFPSEEPPALEPGEGSDEGDAADGDLGEGSTHADPSSE
jgi:hypothetical protein